jgi:transcriptional regulator with XRE-family HTH domain
MTEAQDIGLVLKKLREDAGLSQRELAEQLGLQQPAVARWEAGGVRIPVNRIEELLNHFGYGIEYDLTAVPIETALSHGVPMQLVRRRTAELRAKWDDMRVKAGDYEFAVNPDTAWSIDMWDTRTGQKVPGAVAVYPERIEAVVAHPDGVLIRFGRTVGKVTPNAKRHEDGSPGRTQHDLGKEAEERPSRRRQTKEVFLLWCRGSSDTGARSPRLAAAPWIQGYWRA